VSRTSSLRAVLFDAAGTLIAPQQSVGTTYGRVASRHGVELPAWRLDDAFHRVLRHAPPRVFPDLPAEEVRRQEVGWWRAVVRSTFLAADSTVKFPDFDVFYGELFDAFSTREAWCVRDGMAECLAALRDAGLATGVASNFDHRLPKILQALELEALLDTVAIPIDCGFAKPDAGLFHFACAQLDCLPEQVAHVGDDPARDTEAARRAGLAGFAIGDFPAPMDLVRAIRGG